MALKKALAVGLAVLAAGLGWFVFQETPEEGQQAPAALVLEPDSVEPAVAAEDLPPQASGKRAATEVASKPESARTSAAPDNSKATSSVLRLLTVEDQPVTGADVRVLWNTTRSQMREFRQTLSVSALMESSGIELQASAAGDWPLKPAAKDHFTLIEATKGDLWGKLVVSASEHPVDQTLTMRRDLRLRVRVVDSRGKPVEGVKVLLHSSATDWERTLTSQVSAAQTGLVDFPHLQEVVQEGELRVVLDVLTREKVMRDVELTQLPTDPIELVLPAAGSVLVKVLEADWKPYMAGGEARLRALEPGESHDLSPFNRHDQRMVSTKVEAGIARFEHVEIGLEVQARVARPGWTSIESSAFGSGPQTPDSEVELSVRLGSHNPVVRLRAIAPGGAPFANQVLDVEVSISNRYTNRSMRSQPRTDDRGVFLLDVPHGSGEDSPATLIAKTVGDEDLEGKLELPLSMEDGFNDLGDLLLGEPKIFVGGRVVSPGGAGLGGAQLAIQGRSSEDKPWQLLYGIRESADSDGNFELRKAQSGSEFRIAAQAEGYASTWTTFREGARDVLVELVPEAKITGVLLLDEDIPKDLLQIQVPASRDAGEHIDYRRLSTSPAEDGSFEFTNLIAGEERSLVVSAKQHSKPIFSLDDLVVVAGEASADPRLNPLDLRGKLFVHEVELVLPKGENHVSGQLSFREPGTTEFSDFIWLSAASVPILAGFPTIDLSLQVAGYRREVLLGVRDKIRVVLREAIRVTLILPSTVQLPEAPYHIKAALVPVKGNSATDWSGNAFDEQREITVSAGEAGQRRVLWLVEKRSASSSVGRELRLDRVQQVEVLDVDGDQRIHLDLTQEELDKLIGEMD